MLTSTIRETTEMMNEILTISTLLSADINTWDTIKRRNVCWIILR